MNNIYYIIEEIAKEISISETFFILKPDFGFTNKEFIYKEFKNYLELNKKDKYKFKIKTKLKEIKLV